MFPLSKVFEDDVDVDKFVMDRKGVRVQTVDFRPVKELADLLVRLVEQLSNDGLYIRINTFKADEILRSDDQRNER